MLKSLFSCLIISLVFFLTACEEKEEIVSEKAGMEYYRKGEYIKALPLLKKSADSGNAAASYFLGEMYRLEKGISKNNSFACSNYLKAAKEDYKKAFYFAAICHFLGEGVEKDYHEALKWGKKAAAEANKSQMSNKDRLALAILLGNLYAHGKGTLQDFSEAAKWFNQAAEMGDSTAQGMMAFFYYSGKGVLINKEKARYWGEKAAEQGSSYGEVILGMLNQYSDKPDMKKAIFCYEKAAKKNNRIAFYQLAVVYEKGLAVKQDLVKAHYYYKLAAESGRDYIIEELTDFEARHHLEKTD